MNFVIRLVSTAVAIFVATRLLPGIDVEGSWTTYLWVALVFGLVNATLGTIVRFFTFPLTIVSLGLFLLVINAVMLEVTDALLDSFVVDGFGYAVLSALIVSVVGSAVGLLLKKPLNQ